MLCIVLMDWPFFGNDAIFRKLRSISNSMEKLNQQGIVVKAHIVPNHIIVDWTLEKVDEVDCGEYMNIKLCWVLCPLSKWRPFFSVCFNEIFNLLSRILESLEISFIIDLLHEYFVPCHVVAINQRRTSYSHESTLHWIWVKKAVTLSRIGIFDVVQNNLWFTDGSSVG